MKRVVVAFVLVLLAACSPQPAESVRATTAPTLTVTPVIPTHTPTGVPTVTPPATRTPIFEYPVSWPSVFETPTPIATPQQGSADFRLKALTEADYVALINHMDQVARDWDVPGVSLSRYSYMRAQEPAELLLQEAILRFPDSPNQDAYRWHLAVTRAISGDGGSDPWLTSRIEQALQAGECTIETLDVFLQEHGFKMGRPAKLFDAFEDQRESWTALVSVKAAGRGSGLFLAISRGSDGYKVHRLTSYWNFDHGTSSLGISQDYNQNGLTEILVEIGSHSGTMCSSKMQLFEWHDGEFVDLTKGQIYIFGCSAGWRISNEQIIVHPEYGSTAPEHYFAWDGQYYTFGGVLGSDDDYQPWLDWKTLHQMRSLGTMSPEQEAVLLQKVLVSPEIVDMGSAYPDYLQYRLGVVYAMQSRQAEAVKVFEDLTSNPSDPARDLFPRMARMFLKEYHGDADLYRACLASERLFEQFIPKDRFGNRNIQVLVQQGVNLDWFDARYAMPLCDLNQALSVMARLPDFAEGGLISYLDQNGVEIQSSHQVDINSDGNTEWFLKLDDDLWTMGYTQGQAYTFQEVPFVYQISMPSIEEVKIFQDKESQITVLLMRSGHDWWAGGITQEYKLIPLDMWRIRDQVKVETEDGLPILQVFGEYYSSGWTGYRWDPLTMKFRPDLLEHELFVRKDFAKSVEMSHAWYDRLIGLADNARYNDERAYYLAALSSELAGDSKTAAKIYWQLWQKFPGSPYAILAKAKLEPVPK